MKGRVVALGLAMSATATGSSHASDRLMAYGQHLSQECTACHRIDGVDNGIPSIVGLEKNYFTETLGFYKSGMRNNPAMSSVAQSLDDEQIKALSVYFGSLPPKPAKATSKGPKR